MKRKATEAGETLQTQDVTPRKRRAAAAAAAANGTESDGAMTPSKSKTRTPARSAKKSSTVTNGLDAEDGVDSVTPKATNKKLFATPAKAKKLETPTKRKKADHSAKRKSAKALLEREDEDEWDGENALAQEILEDEEGILEGDAAETAEAVENGEEKKEDGLLAETPSRRGRGRPKGAKNKRSPTPEGDIPPEERYFYQNRSGPPQVSNNTLASLKLLTHEEYFAQLGKYKDPHDPEKAYLLRLHARSFPQWHFEFLEGFSICLYGWGSKRQLVTRFAEYVSSRMQPPPKIIIVNGYVPKTTVRTILSILAETVMGDSLPNRLSGQPSEIVDAIFSHLASHPPSSKILLFVNSVDAAPLRRHNTQSILARLASHSNIHLLATTDTPTSQLLWDGTLRSQFKFVFHDCTTYAPYDAEISVVDDVHELLGRKGHRIGGKEGAAFVLKSLPENARNLYRVLLTEILTVLADGMTLEDDVPDPDAQAYGSDDEGQGAVGRKATTSAAADALEVGIPYRHLYEKASEEFICSSEMSFRTLLKEFHDHQMIVSRKDGSGTELLGVPLGREDIEGVLEELVLG